MTRKTLRGRDALDSLLRGIVGVMRGALVVKRDNKASEHLRLEPTVAKWAAPAVATALELEAACEQLGTHLIQTAIALRTGCTEESTTGGYAVELDAWVVQRENIRLTEALEHLRSQYTTGTIIASYCGEVLNGATGAEAKQKSGMTWSNATPEQIIEDLHGLTQRYLEGSQMRVVLEDGTMTWGTSLADGGVLVLEGARSVEYHPTSQCRDHSVTRLFCAGCQRVMLPLQEPPPL